jgi:alpha-tubulin suppressor-like RCC1 family protein
MGWLRDHPLIACVLILLAGCAGCTEPHITRTPDAGDELRDSAVQDADPMGEPDGDSGDPPHDGGSESDAGLAPTLRLVPAVVATAYETAVRLERTPADLLGSARILEVPEGRLSFREPNSAETKIGTITIPAGQPGVDLFLTVQPDHPDGVVDLVRTETIHFMEVVDGGLAATDVSFELRAEAASIVQGPHTTCVLAGGRAQCMGRTGHGQAGLPARTPLASVASPRRVGHWTSHRFMKLAMEGDFICGIEEHERGVWCWGRGDYAVLGQGSQDSSAPLRVPMLDARATDVDVAPTHACAAREGGVYCWGRNDREQVRPGAAGFVQPTKVEGLPEDFYSVAVGDDFSCAMSDLPSQELYCWGANDVGQLGRGDVGGSSATPVLVDLSAVNAYEKVVRAAGRNVCVLGNGKVFCWGAAALLPARSEPSGAPVLVADQVQEPLALSEQSACIVMGSGLGGVGCWGKNTWQSLQTGRLQDPASPGLVEGLPTGLVTSISTGGHGGRSHCAIIDGLAWCWGFHPDGELGLDARLDDVLSPRPSPFLSAFNFDEVRLLGYAEDESVSCLLREETPLRCWGWARSGQFAPYSAGTELEDIIDEPSSLTSAPAYFTDFEIGSGFVIGRHFDHVSTWGAGPRGELGNGTTDTATRPESIDFEPTNYDERVHRIAAGPHHACAAVRDGAAPGLYCWGSNWEGQLGVPSITHFSPQPLLMLPGAISDVDAASSHTCALADGKAHCWGMGFGSSPYGIVSPGAELPEFVQIVAFRPGAACARTRFEEGSQVHTGEVWCWLGRANPQFVDEHFSDLRGSGSHVCALKKEAGASDLYCWGENDYGQLGTGDRDDHDRPRKVQGLGEVRRFTCGGGMRASTCAEDESGWRCWGNALRRPFDAVPWVAPPTLMLPWQE